MGLGRLHIRPNTVTVLGPFFALAGGIALAGGQTGWAACWVFLMGACDCLDGQLARAQGRVTLYGQFLDATMDRISDALIFLGFILYFALEGQLFLVFLAFTAFTGSFLTSYTRARAELHFESCTAGFWERSERVVLLILGLVFGHVVQALWILAIFTNVTALHRMLVTQEALENKMGFWRNWKGPSALVGKVFFWEYPRYSWQYDIYCLVGIICVTIT